MTGVVWMFVAGGVLFLNLLPILHYAGESNGEEVFENTGYGWPFQIYSTGLFYGPFKEPSLSLAAVGGNLIILILLLIYIRTFCEWQQIESRVLKKGIIWATASGLILGGVWFGWLCFISSLPVISPVSLSIGFKPWWQNWRSATVVSMGTGFVVGFLQALRSLIRPEDLKRRFWWN